MLEMSAGATVFASAASSANRLSIAFLSSQCRIAPTSRPLSSTTGNVSLSCQPSCARRVGDGRSGPEPVAGGGRRCRRRSRFPAARSEPQAALSPRAADPRRRRTRTEDRRRRVRAAGTAPSRPCSRGAEPRRRSPSTLRPSSADSASSAQPRTANLRAVPSVWPCAGLCPSRCAGSPPSCAVAGRPGTWRPPRHSNARCTPPRVAATCGGAPCCSAGPGFHRRMRKRVRLGALRAHGLRRRETRRRTARRSLSCPSFEGHPRTRRVSASPNRFPGIFI